MKILFLKERSFRMLAAAVGAVALVLAIGEGLTVAYSTFSWRLVGFIVGLVYFAYRSIAYAAQWIAHVKPQISLALDLTPRKPRAFQSWYVRNEGL